MCRECQLVNPPATAKAPLRPLPLMEVPFERIGMDLIGPLERSARGYRFALVLVDYATRYPEAVPLCSISAKSVAEVPQASTGFSPFELLYGRQPRGVLDVIKESWEEGPSNSRSEIQYVLDHSVRPGPPRTPLPIWMISSSIVMIGSGIWNISARS